MWTWVQCVIFLTRCAAKYVKCNVRRASLAADSNKLNCETTVKCKHYCNALLDWAD